MHRKADNLQEMFDAKHARAFNPSRYERAFDVRLVLSGTVVPNTFAAGLRETYVWICFRL